jgi:hypothetical protein
MKKFKGLQNRREGRQRDIQTIGPNITVELDSETEMKVKDVMLVDPTDI